MDSVELDELRESVRVQCAQRGLTSALELLQSAVAKHPQDSMFRAQLGHCLWWSGKRAEAEAEIANSLKLNPDNAFALACRAEFALFKSKPADALKDAERAMVLGGDNPSVIVKCASVHQALNDPATTEQLLELVPAGEQTSPQVIAAAAGLYVVLGRNEEFDKCLTVLGETFPDCYLTSLALARKAVLGRDLAVAETLARIAVGAAPMAHESWTTLAQVLGHLDRLDEAEQAARYALEISPTNASVWRVLASLEGKRGHEARSKEYYQLAKDFAPFLTSGTAMREALQLMRDKKIDQALAKFYAVEKNSNALFKRTANSAIIDCLRIKGDLGLLQSHLSKVAAEHKDDAWYNAMAVLKLQNKQYSEAIELLKQGIEEDPAPYGCKRQLLTAYKESNDSEALEAYSQCLVDEEYSSPAFASVIVIGLVRAGKKEAARKVFDKASRKFRYSLALRRSSITLLIAEGNRKEAARVVMSLPPHMRPKSKISRAKKFKKLVRAVWRTLLGKKKS
jgi:tetratricopeptide (TPR) repeat protein